MNDCKKKTQSPYQWKDECLYHETRVTTNSRPVLAQCQESVSGSKVFAA